MPCGHLRKVSVIMRLGNRIISRLDANVNYLIPTSRKGGERVAQRGKDIRCALIAQDRSQVWLIGELQKRGIEVRRDEMCRYLCGKRKGETVDKVLSESERILGLR